MRSGLKIGLALCGSYCTYEKVIAAAERLSGECDLTAIMSETAASTDSRFGKAEDFIARLESITGKPVIKTITAAERVGPGKLFDVIVIAPCTGNTLAKLANAITDTSVTMAAKAHLRNGRPVVIAMSTNDALSGGAMNIAQLLNRKNFYFVPFGQDDPIGKPASLAANFDLIEETVDAALAGRQLQPILLR
ncbi:MAG TPA: dipicolinate synthase subunit B [Clostridiales bacterium]|jgi:dipicolinate synthase subunit B|nr:dipicolinate synthase subunit B [Clostridiales bacterium]HBR07711.1 dipicolinate synthase subunit B [Clostridiales bacterium]